MEGFLHEVIGKELRRRHGIGMMEGKLRPVHVANALMRSEHGTTGRMADIKMLMIATASKESADTANLLWLHECFHFFAPFLHQTVLPLVRHRRCPLSPPLLH